jgi:dienelactone hydrolase
MRGWAWLLLAMALPLGGCLDRYETLRPQTSATDRALRAIVMKPEGAGPFPVVILLHGAAGPRRNGEQWAAELREQGFMAVVPDQYRPLGLTDTLTHQGALRTRYRDTHSLVRFLQSRPDVRPDRIVVMGFSQGGMLAAGVMTSQWDLLDPPGSPALPRPAGGIGFYGLCTFFPGRLHGPLLLLLGEPDDWAPITDCQDWARGIRTEPRPRLVIYPGAHHGFDEPELGAPRFIPSHRNVNRASGWGATVGYDRAAHEASRREVTEFLRALR